jgi:rhomboid family protein
VFPISDVIPSRTPPVVTVAIIVVNVLIFLYQLMLPEPALQIVVGTYAVVPAHFHPATLITSQFLHGGLLHVGGNMLYLWIFGNNIEDAMGHGRFAFFYFACGVTAALAQGFAEPHSTVPMVGASGAISGVLGSYVLIFPRARVNVVIPLGIVFYPVKISAMYVIGFWFLLQLINVLGTASGPVATAWGAHIGGFIVGVVLTPLLSQFPLFGRRPPGPWS